MTAFLLSLAYLFGLCGLSEHKGVREGTGCTKRRWQYVLFFVATTGLAIWLGNGS